MTRSAPNGRLIRRLLLLLTLVAPQAHADQPLPPPADHVVRSPNGRCTARAEAAMAQVRISGHAPDGTALSWGVPGWHRVLVLGDDCRLLGVGCAGRNLLDLDDRDGSY